LHEELDETKSKVHHHQIEVVVEDCLLDQVDRLLRVNLRKEGIGFLEELQVGQTEKYLVIG